MGLFDKAKEKQLEREKERHNNQCRDVVKNERVSEIRLYYLYKTIASAFRKIGEVELETKYERFADGQGRHCDIDSLVFTYDQEEERYYIDNCKEMLDSSV